MSEALGSEASIAQVKENSLKGAANGVPTIGNRRRTPRCSPGFAIALQPAVEVLVDAHVQDLDRIGLGEELISKQVLMGTDLRRSLSIELNGWLALTSDADRDHWREGRQDPSAFNCPWSCS
jgi:hypothetical protein